MEMQVEFCSILRRIVLAATLFVCTAAAAGPLFAPVFEENFPDAFILPNGSQFIAYSTNDGPNVPIAVSSDLIHWSFARDPLNPGKKLDALPKLGRWAKRGSTWAPEVLHLEDHYLLYYAANDAAKNEECVGVAVASNPLGPFTDNNPEPLVCQASLGGTIDPDVFRDSDGKLYLYFKNDGNRVGKDTAIWAQQLAADGLSLAGEPIELIKDDQAWEHHIVEAPTMIRSPAGYQLFFSGASFGWNPEEGGLSSYGIGYASCAGPLGPCTDSPDNPILHSFYDRDAGCLSGPGHQSIFRVGERMFISFHAWEASSGCHKVDDKRLLYIAPIFWKDGKPEIAPGLQSERRSK